MNIELLRDYCKKLPFVSEDIKWGNDLCFLIGGKMFCVICLEHPFRISFKVGENEFGSLSNSEGIIPAPYLARNKWIQVKDENRFSKSEWEFYIRQSYEFIKAKLPKKYLKDIRTD